MIKIKHHRTFHKLIRIFGIQKFSTKILDLISPTFKYKAITYRIRAPESFSVAKEIFKEPTYDLLLNNSTIKTVIDLGCNTGYFTCLLAAKFGKQNIQGILVDANDKVLEECEWHIKKNDLNHCEIICALVGPEDTETSAFYTSEFNISSSALPFDNNYPFPLETIDKVVRDVVSLDALISKFGGERVNVLKIDIEGSESDLLKQNLSCLNLVDWIIIEWHKWVIHLDVVTNILDTQNFELVDVLKEEAICGLALFENCNLPEEISRIPRVTE